MCPHGPTTRVSRDSRGRVEPLNDGSSTEGTMARHISQIVVEHVVLPESARIST